MDNIIDKMVDVTDPIFLEILFDPDKKILWINNENGCKFRACRIKNIEFDKSILDFITNES